MNTKNEHMNRPTLSYSLADKLREAGLVSEEDTKRAAWWRRERRRRQIATLTEIEFSGLESAQVRAAFQRLENHELTSIVRRGG